MIGHKFDEFFKDWTLVQDESDYVCKYTKNVSHCLRVGKGYGKFCDHAFWPNNKKLLDGVHGYTRFEFFHAGRRRYKELLAEKAASGNKKLLEYTGANGKASMVGMLLRDK